MSEPTPPRDDPAGASDEALVDRARSGDAEAGASLYARYWKAARAAAYGAVGDLEDRELELREVEQRLRRLAAEVLPGVDIAVSRHDEPRYRSALRLALPGQPIPAATGGVLAPWPGKAAGVTAVHVRLHLEPWAGASSGVQVAPHDVLDLVDELRGLTPPEPDDPTPGGRRSVAELAPEVEETIAALFGDGDDDDDDDVRDDDAHAR